MLLVGASMPSDIQTLEHTSKADGTIATNGPVYANET